MFCDTEKKPHEQYEEIKEKINTFHGIKDAADSVVIFVNPCTMQIVIKHWIDKSIKSPAKPVNAPLIEECTGIKNYKGKQEQVQEMMELITLDNYKTMRQRISELGTNDSVLGNSNINTLFERLESLNGDWIDEINMRLETCTP